MSELSKEEIKQLVCEVNLEARQKFMKGFSNEVDRFIDECYKIWISYEELSSMIGDNERKAYVVKYVMTAIDNLMISVNLLISSYFTASGNMFRQMLEAILMAVILAHQELDKNYYNEYISQGTNFKVNKVFNIIELNHAKINFNKDDWSKCKNLLNHFHKYSHPSMLSLSSTHHMSKKGFLIIGSEYDEGKKGAYKKELELRISACKFVGNLMIYIKELMTQIQADE